MSKQRISVVTGGASGIGAACVAKLLARGDRVVNLDLEDSLQSMPHDDENLISLACDVGNDQQVHDVAETVIKQFGGVDNLVNCAGVIQPPLPPEDLSMQDWDRVVHIDQRGTYLCCLAFGTHMARAGSGAIVNIASIAGSRSMPLHAYAPAKAAVISMTKGLAVEWGRSGVRVNSVSPGYTRTPALQKAIDAGQRDVSALEDPTALGRMVLPEEIANAVEFLLSDAASAITGVDLPVDAGWLVGNSWATYGGVRPSRTT